MCDYNEWTINGSEFEYLSSILYQHRRPKREMKASPAREKMIGSLCHMRQEMTVIKWALRDSKLTSTVTYTSEMWNERQSVGLIHQKLVASGGSRMNGESNESV